MGSHFAKQDDLSRIITVKTFGSILMDVSSSVTIPVEYDEEKLEYVLNSNLSKPTED